VGVKSVIDTAGIENQSEEELGFFEIFREQDFVTKSDFIEFTRLAERSAQRQLKKWVDEGLIVSEGAGRSTRYRANE
jgi:ATP-dependent DNA helicase RecG